MFFRFGRRNKESARLQGQLGNEALRAGDAEAAERHYRAALKFDPRQATLLCKLGYALHGLGKNAEARQCLGRGLELDPSLSDAHFLMARIAYSEREMEAADVHFSAALDLAPEHELCYFEYCHLLVEQGRSEAARQLIMRAAERFPANADFQIYLGNLHYQVGDSEAAIAAFEHGLALRSNDVATMANLSKVLMSLDRHLRAAEVAQAALALAPQLQDVRLTLAQAFDRMGENEQALRHYHVCMTDPTQESAARPALARLLLRMGRVAEAQEVGADPDFHFLAAHAMQQAGDIEGARAGYRRALALREDHVEALINLSLLHLALSEYEEALRLLSKAELAAPNSGLVHANLGAVLLAAGRDVEAIAAYGRAAVHDEDLFEAHFGLGNALLHAGRNDEAWRSLARAVEIDPGHGGAQLMLGRALQAANSHAAALDALRRAHDLIPDDAQLPLLIASSLIQTGAIGEAIALLQALSARSPGNADVHMLLGSALAEDACFEQARASYECALAIHPDHIGAKASLGLLCLLLGDFDNGWEGYCCLPQTTGMVALPDFQRPLWKNDASLAGKSILLYAEQGMGDAMQFARYLEFIAPMGGNIHLAVQPALLGVMRTLPWPIQLHSKDGPLPATDYYCPLGYLPHAFATRQDTIPAPVPYLQADGMRGAHWRARMVQGGPCEGKLVGIVWAGNPMFAGDRNRSIPFALIERLLALRGYRFYSLQKELRDADAAALAAASNIDDLGRSLTDFAETAAIIANLDLVITVDTSVAHLAGAMGKPVWVMLPFSPDFRWLLGRSDSPWYPSARLFRQPLSGDWASVIDEIFVTLETERK